MDDKLVIIARYGNSAEAHAARLALDGEGIPAVVGDDAAADMLSIMASGLGGAKLLVFERHADRAREILERHAQDKKPVLPPWICHQCGSRVDAGFEVCWSCGQEYDPQRSARAPLDEDDEADEADEEKYDDDEHQQPDASRPPPHDPNPYAPAHASSERGEAHAPRPETPEVTAMVLRAWRAAILGVLVPFLLFYSVWLLFRVSFSGCELSPKSNRRFNVAMALDMLSAGLLILYYQIYLWL